MLNYCDVAAEKMGVDPTGCKSKVEVDAYIKDGLMVSHKFVRKYFNPDDVKE